MMDALLAGTYAPYDSHLRANDACTQEAPRSTQIPAIAYSLPIAEHSGNHDPGSLRRRVPPLDHDAALLYRAPAVRGGPPNERAPGKARPVAEKQHSE